MNTLLIMYILVLVLGIYLFYIAMQMKKTKNINALLVSKEEMLKCKDSKGFINFITPRLAIFSVIDIIIGIVGILAGRMNGLNTTIKYGMAMIILIAFVVFYAQMNRGKRQYFY